MEFCCPKDKFHKILSTAETVTSNKDRTNILLKTDGDKVIVIGTDEEIFVRGECYGNISESGELTVNAKKLLDILKTFPSCDISIYSDERYNITVTSMDIAINAKFKLQCASSEDYPEIQSIEDYETFTIEQGVLKDMIKRTIYASSREEARYFLQGVFFEKEKDSNVFSTVATDGKRLSIVNHILDSVKNYKKFGKVIPQKPLNELIRILKNEGECEIAMDDKRCFFKVDDLEISSNFIDTEFLNYKGVIPDDLEFILKAEKDILIDSIRRVSSILESKERKIRLELRKDKLNIFANNPDEGEATETINIEYDGDDIDIGLNYEFILQTLKEAKSDSIIIEISSQHKPITIREENDETFLAVIGPMRLD